MTDKAHAGGRILGRLRSADGTGIVRMEDRFDTAIDDLWAALTDPHRLARWLGEVEGDLRLGGEFRARLASGWEGTGRIEACEPPRRLLVRTQHARQPDAHPIEVTLTADGDQTILVIEERGVPLDHLADYGAGWQVQVEDLADYLAGRERRDMEARWDKLLPAYQDLAANGSQSLESKMLLAYLSAQRAHVLDILEGLDEEALRQPVLPSGWTCLGLVQHLTLDVERFWFRGVVAGERALSDAPADAWQVGREVSAAAVFALYRQEIDRANAIITVTPPDAAPAWWPPDLFGSWRLHTLREIMLHVMTETACHAGHLDAVRELIDGRRWLVLTD